MTPASVHSLLLSPITGFEFEFLLATTNPIPPPLLILAESNGSDISIQTVHWVSKIHVFQFNSILRPSDYLFISSHTYHVLYQRTAAALALS